MIKFYLDLARYQLARHLIHIGLAIMPDSKFKTRLLDVLWSLRQEVETTISGDTSRHRQHTTKYEDLCQ